MKGRAREVTLEREQQHGLVPGAAPADAWVAFFSLDPRGPGWRLSRGIGRLGRGVDPWRSAVVIGT